MNDNPVCEVCGLTEKETGYLVIRDYAGGLLLCDFCGDEDEW